MSFDRPRFGATNQTCSGCGCERHGLCYGTTLFVLSGIGLIVTGIVLLSTNEGPAQITLAVTMLFCGMVFPGLFWSAALPHTAAEWWQLHNWGVVFQAILFTLFGGTGGYFIGLDAAWKRPTENSYGDTGETAKAVRIRALCRPPIAASVADQKPISTLLLFAGLLAIWVIWVCFAAHRRWKHAAAQKKTDAKDLETALLKHTKIHAATIAGALRMHKDGLVTELNKHHRDLGRLERAQTQFISSLPVEMQPESFRNETERKAFKNALGDAAAATAAAIAAEERAAAALELAQKERVLASKAAAEASSTSETAAALAASATAAAEAGASRSVVASDEVRLIVPPLVPEAFLTAPPEYEKKE